VIGLALKGLARRKVRALLTGLAVIIGVATIAGSYILTDTIKGGFDDIFAAAYEGADAVVTPKTIVDGEVDNAPTIPASVLESLRSRPDVARASGSIASETGAQLTTKSGEQIDTRGAPSLALGVDPDATGLSQITLEDGRLARGDQEVVIDSETARENDYRVGDVIRIQTDQGTRPFTIVGLGSFGGSSLGSATIAVFDVPTAQALLNRGSAYDEITVEAKRGTSADALVAGIAPDLPQELQVRTGAGEAKANSDDIAGDLNIINYFLLTFAAIALFVGSFVIVNTLSITLAQRTREIATLRTLGATRRQVMRSVIAESFIIGMVASMVGLAAGIGLAQGLRATFSALGVDLPSGGTVISLRTIVVSLIVGTLVTVIASILPARRASRVAPVAAVREGAVITTASGSRRAALLGGVVGLLGVVGLVWSLLGDLATRPRLTLMGVGLAALFVGVAIFLPRLVRPLARLVGAPLGKLMGESGTLGRENAMRAPGRTASTAAALMIGLALMTFVAVLGSGLRDSGRTALEGQLTTTHVVSRESGFINMTPGIDRAAAGADGVEVATGVRSGSAKFGDEVVLVSGVDPTPIGQVLRVDWNQGSPETLRRLGDSQAVVNDDFAKDNALRVGSPFTVTSAAGVTQTFSVAGIYSPARFDSLLSPVVITQSAFGTLNPRPSDALILARMSGSSAEGRRSLAAALSDYPDAEVADTAGFVDERASGINQLLNLLYVLLALSVIVSLFGMLNTLALAVLERTREVGLLRAIGMSRRQTRRMIRAEGITTALIGAALGLPIGIGLAALVTKALEEYDVGFSIPVVSLGIFTVVAIILGVLAATLPGRRAAKQDVLKALHYE
jgi:putative ABC transport system permease protein